MDSRTKQLYFQFASTVLATGNTFTKEQALLLAKQQAEKEREFKKKQAIRRGLKCFTFRFEEDTVDIYALNKKNAIKKYNKLKQKKNGQKNI